MEFYVAFWKLLSGDLVDVFNASLETGLLPFFQREALIDFQHLCTSQRERRDSTGERSENELLERIDPDDE